MAVGDLAASIGLSVVPDTADVKKGYEDVNRRGDELADHVINGTHAWSKISDKPATFPPSSHQHPATAIGTSAMGFPGNVEDALVDTRAIAFDAYDAVSVKRNLNDGNFGSTPIYTPHGRSNQVTTSYVAAYINSDGRIGASPSSLRYKENVTDLSTDLADILALRPVEFDRINGGHEVGLIAEEAVQHVPAIVVRSLDGEQVDGVHYHLLPVLLLKLVQDQDARIRELERRLEGI